MSEQAQILSLLEQNDPESVREGAQLAGEARLTRAIPALVRNMSSTNIGVQEAVDQALRRIGGSSVVVAIIPLLRSENVPVRNLAMDILREIGGNNLQAVIKLLHDTDPDIRIFAADILGSMQSAQVVPSLCTALLHDPEVNVRYQAAVSLGTLAFPESARCLNTSLEDEEWVQFAAIEALTKLRDSSSTQPIIKALAQASDLVASSMVDALGEMGDLKAVPLLLKRLESSPTPLRNKIVRAIINIMGPSSLSLLGKKECDRLRGYLPSALEDEDIEIQDAAVKGFSVLGGKEALADMLRHAAGIDPDQEPERIAAAIEAMIAIGRSPELEQALQEGDDLTMQIAMEVLLRQNADMAVPMVINAFGGRSRDMQRVMIMELATFAGREHQPFFLDVLRTHTDGIVLRGALLFLGRKGDPDLVFPLIIPLLNHRYNDVKESAMDALVALHTEEVENFFKQLAVSDDTLHRMMGVYALGHFAISSTRPELAAALDDDSAEVRKAAVLALGKNCPLNADLMSQLEEKLDDESREVRMAAFDTLGLYPDEHYSSLLIDGLYDPDAWVRIRCAERLGSNRVIEAVEPLVDMLEDENPLIVIKAAEALGAIKGEAAFRALLPLLEHPDKDIREAADEALDAIRRRAGE